MTTKKKAKRKSKGLAKKKTGSSSLIQTDPMLQAYMREVNKYPLLSRDEEKSLAIRYYEEGDREALQELVTKNLRFVVKIAFEYVHYRLKLLDLIQEGNMGLLKAVEDFNPYKDVRITTYAVWWIRSYIQEAILKNYSLVKIGTTQAQKRLFYRLRREQEKMEKMGIVPEQRVKLLAAKLDVKEKEIREMNQRLSHSDLSLSAPLSSDDSLRHEDRLHDEAVSVDEALGEVEQIGLFREVLQKFAKTLEGREKLVFEKRLTSEKPMTLKEIGEKYGVSKERARQIEEKLKSKLKDYVRENYPDYEILTDL